MKIYFDESGNTGCIIPNKNGALYNDEQRISIKMGLLAKCFGWNITSYSTELI